MRRAFGAFVAIQTFFLLARGDRFEVLFFWTRESWPWVLVLWLKDLALASAAGWAAARVYAIAARAAEREEADPPAVPAKATETALVVSALALGATLRWAFASWNPPGLWVDAVWLARPALEDPRLSVFGASAFGETPGGHELVSNLVARAAGAIVGLFGGGASGYFALSALPGCAALPALWWCAREAYGPRTAAVAAFGFALLGWPLLLARWTTTASMLLALVLLGAAAALAALRTGRTALAVLAGASVGLSLHTHASAGAVAAGFGAFALLMVRRGHPRRLALAAAAAAALAFAPLAWGFLERPGRLGGHLRDVRLGTPVKAADAPRARGAWNVPWTLASNALDYSGILLFTRDPNARHAIPGRGVLTPLAGAAALLGLGLAARRRRPADLLLVLVGAGGFLAGILSNPGGAPNTLRACAVAGPAAILAAAVADLGVARAARTGAAREALLFAGLFAATAAAETLPILTEYPFSPAVAAAFCPAETGAGRLLANLPGEAFVDPAAVERPAVVAALAPAVRRGAAALCSAPPPSPFWFVGARGGLDALHAAGFRCGRGLAPSGDGPGVLLARVAPPGRR